MLVKRNCELMYLDMVVWVKTTTHVLCIFHFQLCKYVINSISHFILVTFVIDYMLSSLRLKYVNIAVVHDIPSAGRTP